jgi:hypothetical protein
VESCPREKLTLGSRFREEEVKVVVFGYYADEALELGGLSLFYFYQQQWNINKFDLMAIFEGWYSGDLDLYRLNFVMITLIPREKDARIMIF